MSDYREPGDIECAEADLDRCECSRTQRVYCHSLHCHGGADLGDYAEGWIEPGEVE